jgi:phosphoribosylformylglycinamidine cyclo-ligase
MDRRTWTPQPVFGYIAGHGRIQREEMESAFNMGIGMVAVIGPDDVDRAMAVLTARHVPSHVLGTVDRTGHDQPRATLSGDHPRF